MSPTTESQVEFFAEKNDQTPLLSCYEEVIEDDQPNDEGEDIDMPTDNYHLAYFLMFFISMASLFPWNTLINATGYFQHLLVGTKFGSSFENYISSVNMIMNVLFSLLFVRFGYKVSIVYRISIPFFIQLCVFLVITIMVDVHGSNPETDFKFTLALVAICGSANAILNGGLFGLASTLPPKYISATMIGQAVSGIVVSLANIATQAIGGDPITSARIYFICACVVLFLGMLSYIVLMRLPFVLYCFHRHQKDKTDMKPKFHIMRTVKQIWPQMLNVFLIFLVTLTLFPNITKNIYPDGASEYYVSVACFLSYNVFDFLGRLIAGYVQFPSHKFLFIPVLARFVFFFFFLFCNTTDIVTDGIVFFSGGVWPALFMCLFALSNGYYSSLCMMYAPGLAKKGDEECSGSVMVAFIGFGLVGGSVFSFAFMSSMY